MGDKGCGMFAIGMSGKQKRGSIEYPCFNTSLCFSLAEYGTWEVTLAHLWYLMKRWTPSHTIESGKCYGSRRKKCVKIYTGAQVGCFI